MTQQPSSCLEPCPFGQLVFLRFSMTMAMAMAMAPVTIGQDPAQKPHQNSA